MRPRAYLRGLRLKIGVAVVHLTPQETAILIEMQVDPLVTPKALSEALWPNPDLMPDTWHDVIKSRICSLNKRLRPSGWKVRNLWGRGYTLERQDGDSL